LKDVPEKFRPIIVSSHAPVRGHPLCLRRLRVCIYNGFKSCPREGASANDIHPQRVTVVSSHAPVRGHLPDSDTISAQPEFQVMPP